MGLIQKQLNAGLDDKITNWVNENLPVISRGFSIGEDHRINIMYGLDVIYIIKRLIEDDLDIPDYISFSTPFIIRYYRKVDPDKLMDALNKYTHAFSGLHEAEIMAYGTCLIKLVKTDGKFIKMLDFD
jgi:hypothetical protein